VKKCLLDSSFVIDLLNEMAEDREGGVRMVAAQPEGAALDQSGHPG